MGNELTSTRVRFGPIAVAAALLGLTLGLAMPVSPVAAGVPSDTTATASAKHALPSEAAKTDGVIVIAGKDKNKNKNWNNSKNWKHYDNKKVVVVRPYRKWYKRPYYGTVVAAAFAVTGLLLGARLRKKEVVVREVTVEVPAPAHFEPDRERIAALGITPRELEVLELIAAGLSNREMAERLFVSENTVKTHASRVFDKLGAGRRTQAVQIAKQQRIIA